MAQQTAPPPPALKLPPIAPRRRETSPPDESAGQLGKAERSILRALYWLKDETPTKAKVSFYSGYSLTSSSFTNALGKLRTLGLAEGLEITDAGIAALPDSFPPKPSGMELREWLRSKLGRAENALLDAMIAAGGQKVSNADLADASGYSLTSSSFTNALGKLRTIEAAEGYDREGGTKAADVFFE